MSQKKAVIYMVLAAILWSTAGMLIKLVSLHPMAIAGIRSGIAAIVMLPFVRINKNLFTKNKLLAALFYSLTVILFVNANKLTTSVNAIFLQFTAPIWVALFSRWFLKSKIRRSDWVAIIVIFLGMGLFFIDNLSSGRLIGNILGLISGFTFAGMIVSFKQQEKGATIGAIFVGNVFNAVLCLPFYFLAIPNTKSLLGLVLLGVFQVGIAYILYAKAIEHLTVIEGILIPALEPILNPVWVLLIIHEVPSSKAIVGGIIVISALITRSIYQTKVNSNNAPHELTFDTTTT
ncbi:MAG: EamA family transporter [Firmicutes bacterium HGW-Firmicutes-7]|nr:MAG: EamA family transporter [Firmicutes bacterium HGW-Firmicutes-7]